MMMMMVAMMMMAGTASVLVLYPMVADEYPPPDTLCVQTPRLRSPSVSLSLRNTRYVYNGEG